MKEGLLSTDNHSEQMPTLTPPKFKFSKSKPRVFIVSGISGAGKDTVIERLRERNDVQFHFVITCNTREKRIDEIDGVHYHFVSREKFKDMISKNELVEYAAVYSDYKGVPKFEFDKAFEKGQDLILRLDHQGARKVKQVYPDAISIFIAPPDSQTWLARLINRGSDSEDELRVRVQTAEEELKGISEFDYLIINDHLDRAVDDLIAIVRAEHLRTALIQISEE